MVTRTFAHTPHTTIVEAIQLDGQYVANAIKLTHVWFTETIKPKSKCTTSSFEARTAIRSVIIKHAVMNCINVISEK